MENTDKIKAKIKALLSKTEENGATKWEMESALNKANQLMTEHFISEHDLKDTVIINKCISESFPLTKSGFDLGIFYYSLGRLFDCEQYFDQKTITFFGYEQDVALCGYFYNLISKTCLKEKDEYLKSEAYQIHKQYNHGKKLSKSFIKGFLINVSIKMEQMYKDREKNIPMTYSLMVIDKKEKRKAEFEDLGLKLRVKKNSIVNIEKQAFIAGSEKGKNINLTKGIEDTKQQNQLLKISNN